MGIFVDELTELVVAADHYYRKRVSVYWRFNPSDPAETRWSVWVDCAPDQVWSAETGIAALKDALKTLRAP